MDWGEPVVLVTQVAAEGPAPGEPGARLLVFPDGRTEGTVGGGALEERAIQDASAMFTSGGPRGVMTNGTAPRGGRTFLCTYELVDLGMLCGGRATLFYELLSPKTRLLIFGAGHVGTLLAELAAKASPFRVELYDGREERAAPGPVPDVTVQHLPGFAELPSLERHAYVVICTDSHATDLELAKKVLTAEPAVDYVGMLGSRVKAEEFRRRLGEAGVPKERVRALRCPVGLPIGGKGPGAVAVSILSELLAFHHGRLTEAEGRLAER
jgi:xanthine dehydrogenase accessory factor